MSILVTGHTLFLGKRVVARLEEEGARVIVSEVDFRSLDATKALFEKEKPEVVIHCDIDTSGLHYLAEQPGDIFFNSTLISLHLQEAARLFGVTKFINPMTSATYPTNLTEDLKESDWWNGPFYDMVSVIGLVRKTSWMNAYAFNKQYGLQYANLIITNIYGPGDYFDEARSYAMGSLMKKMVEAKQQKAKRVVVWGTGKPVRDWIYVDDVVEILLRSIVTETGIEPINIGTGRGISIGELAKLIAKAADYTGEFIYDTTKPDGTAYRVMNTDRCKALFKWEPPTTLENGIVQTLTWYLNHR